MTKDPIRRSNTLPQPRAAKSQATRLEELGAIASAYIDEAKAENTKKSYRSDWANFTAWCGKYRRPALPAAPETVAYYLADRTQDLKPSTLMRRLATISEAHRAAGFESPTKHAQVK